MLNGVHILIFKNIPYYLTGLTIFFLLFKSGLCLASSPKLEIGILFSLPHNVQEESQKLSGEVTRRLIAHFPENPPKNIPHISLFQLKIEESRLPELIENLGVFLKKNPFLPTLTMRSSLTDTQENIFWTVERIDDETNLNDFHKSIVEIAAAYRSSELMEQVRMLRNLSLDQREKVKNYGIFWGLPGNLNPHITLFYDSGVDRKDQNKTFISIKDLIGEIAVTPGIVFKAQSLAIGKLGRSGNVEKILYKFE
ncbi:hypothetical protein BJP44_05225 [Candidatus Williamhamiltonella defendens]|uniref:Uncharacterized protein n=1 Tax=Hamiltonella defensa subsp. Acyrthosiphon pisum (strain 5AT) TaxID=572265 RepID=C4K5I9_HAMD5|nr:hypothetical protein HDEF_1170 [Candidatus Hamiltonella defensa 5AT (Acyrthosiphon pisum)]ATW22491.1 hypothetical protein BJP44_05225 [Candidatus Hamiltonella defensa]